MKKNKMSVSDIVCSIVAANFIGVAILTVGAMSIDHYIQNPIIGILCGIMLFATVVAGLLKVIDEVY